MAMITFVLVGLGVALIITGTVVSVSDWNRKHRQATSSSSKNGEVVTEPTGLPESLTALAKVADSLKGHPLGMQLIIVGIVLLVIAGLFGGTALAITD